MKKTIGLISANYTSDKFGALTAKRTPATLPYGGRYRLIDFPLSNMVNSGISTVGLVTSHNSRRTMSVPMPSFPAARRFPATVR